MTEKHWSTDKAARKRLVDFANQHGLDGKGIVEVLDVEKVSEFAGTEAEAIGKLAAWARQQAPPIDMDEHDYADAIGADFEPEPTYEVPTLNISDEDQASYFEACTRLPETPVIAWTVFQDHRGYEWSYTIHAGLPASQATIARQLVAAEIAAFHLDAARYGWSPLIDSRRIGGNGNGTKPALQLVQPGNRGDLTFQATQLVGSMMSGKTYWNVIGPRFPQYGVRIWPEVLKASGFDPETLDPAQQYPLEGYTATYVEKEKDDKLIADKVVKLEKAA